MGTNLLSTPLYRGRRALKKYSKQLNAIWAVFYILLTYAPALAIAATAFNVSPVDAQVINAVACLGEEDMVNAVSVVSFDQGTQKDGDPVLPERSDPNEALGTPDDTFVSLGTQGELVLAFDEPVMNVPGDDLAIHETTNGVYPDETASVEVSQNGSTWQNIGSASNMSDPTFLDFDATGWNWIQYVRVTDTTNYDLHDGNADGYDLDAVAACDGAGEIGAVKYFDTNVNGQPDNGENRLSGWTMRLYDANWNLVDTKNTTANGAARFPGTPVGTWYICEVLQDNWSQTGVTSNPVTNQSGALDEAELCNRYDLVDPSGPALRGFFGNILNGEISGQKWEDLDGDGNWDENEPTVEGWTINVYQGEALVDTTETDENGMYSFELIPGQYLVMEGQQPDWVQTYPCDVREDVRSNVRTNAIPEGCDTGHEVTVFSGEPSEGYNFGNFHLGRIAAVKIHDLNGNGLMDPEEQSNPANFLNGWEMHVYDNEWNLIESKETGDGDDDGKASFTGLGMGQYYICEMPQEGWTQTGLNGGTGPTHPETGLECHKVLVNQSGDNERVIFMNFTFGRIDGYKWQDSDGDGDWDENESALGNWTIQLWQGEIGGIPYATDVTDNSGYYSFEELPQGTYYLTEVQDPENWEQTFPVSPDYHGPLVINSGDEYTNYNFGNQLRFVDLGLIKYDEFEDELEHIQRLYEEGETVVPGQQFTYTIEVTNDGTRDAEGVNLTDNLSPYVTFVSATVNGVECNAVFVPGDDPQCFYYEPGHQVFWQGYELESGASMELTVTVLVNETVPADALTVNNAAHVSNCTQEEIDVNAPHCDLNLSNNFDFDINNLEASPELVLTKDDGITVINPGDTTTYIIGVENVGNRDAANIVLTETVPANTTYTGLLEGWTCGAETAGSTCTYSVGTVEALAGPVFVEFTVTVDDPTPEEVEEIINTVSTTYEGEVEGEEEEGEEALLQTSEVALAAVGEIFVQATDIDQLIVPDVEGEDDENEPGEVAGESTGPNNKPAVLGATGMNLLFVLVPAGAVSIVVGGKTLLNRRKVEK